MNDKFKRLLVSRLALELTSFNAHPHLLLCTATESIENLACCHSSKTDNLEENISNCWCNVPVSSIRNKLADMHFEDALTFFELIPNSWEISKLTDLKTSDSESNLGIMLTEKQVPYVFSILNIRPRDWQRLSEQKTSDAIFSALRSIKGGAESETSIHLSGEPSLKLSERQHKILTLLEQSITPTEIAQKWAFSPSTIHQELHLIYRIFGVRNKFDALEKWSGYKEFYEEKWQGLHK